MAAWLDKQASPFLGPLILFKDLGSPWAFCPLRAYQKVKGHEYASQLGMSAHKAPKGRSTQLDRIGLKCS